MLSRAEGSGSSCLSLAHFGWSFVFLIPSVYLCGLFLILLFLPFICLWRFFFSKHASFLPFQKCRLILAFYSFCFAYILKRILTACFLLVLLAIHFSHFFVVVLRLGIITFIIWDFV